jgi:hypothetical protein
MSASDARGAVTNPRGGGSVINPRGGGAVTKPAERAR